MTDFPKALAYVLRNEGGFIDDPDDPGGATNCGITLAALSHWLGRPATVAELISLSDSEVSLLYFTGYWKPLGCHSLLSEAVATALFDVGVLFGLHAAVVCAQRAAVDCGAKLTIDGHNGFRTNEALNGVDPKNFIEKFVLQLRARITDIVAKRPSSAKYQDGWEDRLERLKKLAA